MRFGFGETVVLYKFAVYLSNEDCLTEAGVSGDASLFCALSACPLREWLSGVPGSGLDLELRLAPRADLHWAR